MANGMNKVFLLGYLGNKPELTKIPSGDSVLRMRIATSEKFKNKEGNLQEHTEWHTVKLWGKRADALAGILGKGDRVMVEGEIRTRSYEKEGSMRYVTEVRARDIQFAGLRDRSAEIEVDVDIVEEAKLGVPGRRTLPSEAAHA